MTFELYYPVKPYEVNQVFGNPDPKYSAMGLNGHNGVDLKAAHGRPIYASHEGLAHYEIDDGGGHGVIVTSLLRYPYKDTQVYMKSIYWHMCDSSKEPQFKSPIEGKDMIVKPGDLLGYADNTGLSTGDHLHLGLKPLDSYGNNVEQTNGYLGAIDPVPYLNGKYAQDINLKYQYVRDLGLWSWGTDVYQLQKRLVAEGYGDFTPTGLFFTKTLAAVKAYQKSRGIEQTGFCGPISRAALNNS